jgi:hypothetical protein
MVRFPGAVHDGGTRLASAGAVVTRVAGGFLNTPSGVPTAFDPRTFNFAGLSPVQWFGSWTGVSTAVITDGHFDPATGSVTVTVTDTFTGEFADDHSHGTLVMRRHFAGNVLTGAGFEEGDIIASSGDPSFQCSSGHIALPQFANGVVSYGGYEGTWVHGCPARTNPATPPTSKPAAGTRIDGGLISAPAGVPTSGDPSKLDFAGICTEEWSGDLTGQSVCDVRSAHVDAATGVLTADVIDTFTGSYLPDRSTGTLTLHETVDWNLLTGAGLIVGDIVSGSGDPTFGCSSGHITLPFYGNPAAAFGGYDGTWTHGCPPSSSHR